MDTVSNPPCPAMRLLAAFLLALALAAPARAQLPTIDVMNSPVPSQQGRFGDAVARVPDVDGDGADDWLIGAPGETSTIVARLGRAYAISSATGERVTTFVTGTPIDATDGRFGAALAGVPDLDGDGRGEVLIGAPGERVAGALAAGRAYVLAGPTGDVLLTLPNPNPAAGEQFGWSVAVVPSVNPHPRPDFAVGMPTATVQGVEDAGWVYVFDGVTGGNWDQISSTAGTADARFGHAIVGLADVNDDGRGDLLIGAPGADGGRGRAYIHSGADGALLRTVVSPLPSSQAFGWALAVVPDVNHDGVDDWLVGAPEGDENATNAGAVHLYSGANGVPLLSRRSPHPVANGRFGAAVAGLPDMNGDGRGDLLVGAPGEGESAPGRVYVLSGNGGAVIAEQLSPADWFGQFGIAVAAVADADGDGRADLLVGSPAQDGGGVTNGGRTYVLGTGAPVAAEAAPDADALALVAAPTPTSGAATVRFTLPDAGGARLTLHDALGRTVATLVDGALAAGPHAVAVDAGRLAPGVYVARLVAAGGAATTRLVVAR